MLTQMRLATALILLALIGTANAATYHVSPNGSGLQDGSSEGNSFSLTDAISHADSNPDEEIVFILAAGNYGGLETYAGRNAWVTWQASGNAVFTSLAFGRYSYAPDIYFKFEGIVVSPELPFGRAITIYNSKYIEFYDLELIGPGFGPQDNTDAVYLFGSEHITISGCRIYGTGEAPRIAFYDAIYGRVSNDVLIEDCDISQCNTGIQAWGRNWTIRNNEIHHLNYDGIVGADLADSLIENNVVHDITRPENTGHHNDLLQFWNVNPEAGPGTIPMHNVTIRGNTFYRSDGQVVLWNHFHYRAENMVFENNLIYGARTTAAEFHVAENDNLLFKNNTIIGSTLFRGNEFSGTVHNNIMSLYAPSINEGVVINSEQNNIIDRFASWLVPAGSSYSLSDDTIELETEALYDIFANAPDFDDTVAYDWMEYDAIIGETQLEGRTVSTFTVSGIDFSSLNVFPKYNLRFLDGTDAFSCYDTNTGEYACYDLFIWKIEGDTLTLVSDFTNIPGATVRISVPYSNSTRTRIYVGNGSLYEVGDVIDYDFVQVAHTVTAVDSDSFGDYIDLDSELFEEARAFRKFSNWGQGHHNVTRDFTPKPEGLACPGGNQALAQGEYIGAIECAELDYCLGTDLDCGVFPNCQSCNGLDSCSGDSYFDYSCTGTNCSSSEDDCSDCSCDCGGYKTTESAIVGNCSDGKDNDCDGQTDSADSGCSPGGGVMLWLTFDENMQDVSGNGNHGTCSEDACPAHLPEGGVNGSGAYSFDGIDDVIRVNPVNGDNSREGTHAFWVFNRRLVDAGGIITSSVVNPLITTTGSNGLRIFIDNSSSWPFKIDMGAPECLPLNEWNFYAVTYDSEGAKLYRNGEEIASKADARPEDDYGATGDLFIGSERNIANRYVDAIIDDVRIYDRALLQAEVEAIYRQVPEECIDTEALLGYISDWKHGTISMLSLMEKIGQWKAGTGCP